MFKHVFINEIFDWTFFFSYIILEPEKHFTFCMTCLQIISCFFKKHVYECKKDRYIHWCQCLVIAVSFSSKSFGWYDMYRYLYVHTYIVCHLNRKHHLHVTMKIWKSSCAFGFYGIGNRSVRSEDVNVHMNRGCSAVFQGWKNQYQLQYKTRLKAS